MPRGRRLGAAAGLLAVLFVLALSTATGIADEPFAGFATDPLQPADTSSPRDTLRSFDDNITAAMQAWRQGQTLQQILGPGRRALETIDFSKLPEQGRFAKEVETALLLKEILDRIKLPPEDEIPDDTTVDDKQNPVSRWSIPQTRITIARIDGGARAGEFLFTADTVTRLADYYEATRHLPYKPGALVGIYDEYTHGSGLILPRSWSGNLPTWSKRIVLGQAVWQWLGLAIVAAAAVAAVRALLRWGRRWDERHAAAAPRARFGLPAALLAGVAVAYFARLIILLVLGFIGDAWTPLSTLIWVLTFAALGWLVVLVTGRVADAVNAARYAEAGSIDSHLVRIVLRLASLVLLVSLFIYAAGFFGIPLTPVIASLGVGGLAIALAVRPTLENVIGGLTLFADKPVRIGDFCRFGSEEATVEEIGLRSTRLRKLDDTVISMPNSDFSQRELTNYSRRRRRLYQTTIGLRYETTEEQLRAVIVELDKMLRDHPQVLNERLHVRFDGFGASSLDVAIFVYVSATDWLQYLEVREDINFKIMSIVGAVGTGFAFPSQTSYLALDPSLGVKPSA
ncbi:MAG: mechanosensitive ion channel family protein [Rhodospirillales bacterium]|nr:mechanosensitive ion channel family protein [Rhodospirillales bacterium]